MRLPTQAADMIRAGKVIAAADVASVGAGASGRVLLDHAGRFRRRGVLETESGEKILLDLPEAVELPDGGALLLEDGRTVTVTAADEPLAAVSAGPRQLARLAWHVGNRHTPCEVQEGRLLIHRDHVLEAMLAGLGAQVSHVEAPFRPEGGAYGHGRTHGHDHGHSHGHAGGHTRSAHDDPNAHIPHRYE